MAFDPFLGELAQIRQDNDPTTVLELADDMKINTFTCDSYKRILSGPSTKLIKYT